MAYYREKPCQVCIGCGRCGEYGKDLHVITDSFLATGMGEITANVEGAFVLVDIGTTTIAMELYNKQGKKQAEHVLANPQRIFGADVISRIQAAENPINLRQMQTFVKKNLERGIQGFLQQSDNIKKIYITGNTTMLYILNGHQTDSLGYAPFRAEFLQSEELQIGGISAVTLPGLAAFVGADVVAGILACGIHRSEEISLLIDLGTNGEMVLGNSDKMLACSTAAGPVFDGLCNKTGQSVWGADVIHLAAVLIEKGIVDDTGLLIEPYFTTGIDVGGVHITQESIRQLQTAKAAIAAGIECLVQEYGLQDVTQIKQVYLAGGMGYFLKEEATMKIGLLPQELKGKVQSVGNTALAGTYYYSTKRGVEQEIERILQCTKVINLVEIPNFSEKFVNRMDFCKKTIGFFEKG